MSWAWALLSAVWLALGIYHVARRREIAARSGRGTAPRVSARFGLLLGLALIVLAVVTFADLAL